MLDTYRVVRISQERLKDLLVLFTSAFGQKVSLSYLERKFDTRRFGASFVGYIAYTQNGAPAAYYGVFPIRFRLGDRVIVAAQSGDTMTHKDHQGKGLFTKLAKMTYDLARQEGVEFVFGFPNDNSLPGFTRKLNWAIDGERYFFKRRVYTFPLAALMHKIGLKQAYKAYFQFWAERFGLKCVPNGEITERANSIYYDEEAIRYRNFSDNYFVEEQGCVIWIKIARTMQIGCIYKADDQLAIKMINRLKWLCVLTGLFKISFWCTDNHPNHKFIQTYFNIQTNAKPQYFGHVDLAGNLPHHLDFLFEPCDGDTY